MERSYPNTFNAEEVLEKMRNDFKKQLEKCFRNTIPQVFLISSWDLRKYDFPRLVETLEKALPCPKRLAFLLSLPNFSPCLSQKSLSEGRLKTSLPSLKRTAFLLSLPNFSSEVIEKKKSALKSHLWKTYLASAGINEIPLPGLPLACDVALLLGSLVAFYKRFELDDGSLARRARLARKPVEELKAVMKSPQEEEINGDLVIKKITDYAKELFPPLLVRSLVAAEVSFAIIYWMLLSFLDNLAEDAHRVRKKALGLEECEAEHLRAK
ncbi:interferon-inducible GTPase 5-like [Podarcis raffonei]|uniref:interferon-inducible GTPase 5-like n=1 Tax=Podarcis raffonei TaxID=65483 RepID=UPI0023293C94|nr:interferon-inducible GTPase 5-like [Podarcis raffonei]